MGCTKLHATMRGAKFQQVEKKLRRILQESEKGGNAIMHQAVQWVAGKHSLWGFLASWFQSEFHPSNQNYQSEPPLEKKFFFWQNPVLFIIVGHCLFEFADKSYSNFVLQISLFLNFRLKLYQKTCVKNTVYLLLVFVCLCLGARVCLSATMHWWARAVRPR